MAEIVWSEPALADLDAIADYIALENPVAASELVKRIFGHIGQLADHPESGSRPQLIAETAIPARVCVWITHCTSGRALWIAPWIT